MFRKRLFTNFVTFCKAYSQREAVTKIRKFAPVALGILTTASCEENHGHRPQSDSIQLPDLEHEFLIKQATTVNVNAATQLLTVTLIAIQDTSERLRDALTKEICLVKQAIEWGDDGTPPQHWDQLVEVRGDLGDLNHNLRTLFSYMEYAEKLATVAAEISYLSGNTAASDAICQRMDHASRTCNTQKQLTHILQQESLELQQRAIILCTPELQEKLKKAPTDPKAKDKK